MANGLGLAIAGFIGKKIPMLGDFHSLIPQISGREPPSHLLGSVASAIVQFSADPETKELLLVGAQEFADDEKFSLKKIQKFAKTISAMAGIEAKVTEESTLPELFDSVILPLADSLKTSADQFRITGIVTCPKCGFNHLV